MIKDNLKEDVCVLCGRRLHDLLFVHGKGVCEYCFTELYVQSITRIASISESRYIMAKGVIK
ncbi:MAG: hypothetical protein ACPLTR_04705 [Thermacetogeniaceae bacterium]